MDVKRFLAAAVTAAAILLRLLQPGWAEACRAVLAAPRVQSAAEEACAVFAASGGAEDAAEVFCRTLAGEALPRAGG